MATLLLFVLACGGGKTAAEDPRVPDLIARVDALERELAEVREAERQPEVPAPPTGARPPIEPAGAAGLATRVEQLEARLDELAPDIEDAVDQLDAVDADLAAVEDETAADVDELDALAASIDALDSRVDDLDETLGELDAVVAAHIEATAGVEALLKKVRIDRDGNVVFVDAKLLTQGSNDRR